MTPTKEIPYGSKIEGGCWAAFNEETRTYHVRVIDRRHGDIRFPYVDMPERNHAGVRRYNVMFCNMAYTSEDGYNSDWAAMARWDMEDGSIEMYRTMLDEVDPIEDEEPAR